MHGVTMGEKKGGGGLVPGSCCKGDVLILW